MSSVPSPTAEAAPASLFAGYQPLSGCYDEFTGPDGAVRPHCRKFQSAMDALGPQELNRRVDHARRQIRENGVTFNAIDEAGDATRPWELDAIPLIVPAQEWKGIGAGLAQRARLLDATLDDLLGEQRLVREQVIPAALVLGHPDFYRSYHGLPKAGQRRVHLYAADVARSAAGEWIVAGDRCRAPSGLGYLLENRIVTSRMHPDVFRQSKVQRLAPFFIALQDLLRELAPRFRDNPRIALFSPGPESYRHFEDAYLARYLGITLVQGGDLAVRHDRVNVKTLGGLLPVEVLFRHVSDEDCDPVELRGDSDRGVPGLLQVLRGGNATVVNSLGTRLVETPAFKAFWPRIARFLFGEDLQLPSVRTWWCGAEDDLAYVLDHLDELTIRPAYRVEKSPPVLPATLSQPARAALIEQIKADPARYIGQEAVARSTMPVWTATGAAPWSMALRTFLIADKDDYSALPGGLVRTALEQDSLDRSMTAGERSQDCWVLSEGPVDERSLLQPSGQPIALRRSGAELPSRVADNLFWIGRLAERAEGSARLLRCVLTRLISESDAAALPELDSLVRALIEQGQVKPDFAVEGLQQGLPELERAIPEAVFDETEHRSVRRTITALAKTASSVRDRISMDAWRLIHRIDTELTPPRRRGGEVDPADVLELLDDVIIDLSALSGLSGESMTRTLGWTFLDMGRRIERAWHTTSLLRATLVARAETETPVLAAVLETVDSIMTYRSRYLASLQPAAVLDLVLTDETNPRSIAYQLHALADHARLLPRDTLNPILGEDERLVHKLFSEIRLADILELVAEDRGGRSKLERLLVRLNDQLPRLSDALSQRYLIHAGVALRMSAFTGISPGPE